jgi:hypothetical protein
MTTERKQLLPSNIAHFRASRVENGDGRHFLARWGEAGRLFRFDKEYLEFIFTPEAVETLYIDGGFANVRRAHNDVTIEGQLGALLHGEACGNCVEMIGQWGHGALAEILYRDTRAGIGYGCSVGVHIIEKHRIDAADLELPAWRVTRWAIQELTITALRHGVDDRARVACAADLQNLLEARRRNSAAREAKLLARLPDEYAEPLRQRVSDMATRIAASIGYFDPDAIERALRQELDEAFSDITVRHERDFR